MGDKMNNLLQMMMSMGVLGNIKDKLLQLGIDPSVLQGVNFNDMNSLNSLAQKIMPQILANNKGMANKIKQASSMFGAEKQNEVAEVIDMTNR